MIMTSKHFKGLYRIKVDNNGNYTSLAIGKKKDGKNKGEETAKLIGHFSNPAAAVKSIIEQKLIAENDEISLKDYINSYRSLLTDITKELSI